jgi:hypothetical protein
VATAAVFIYLTVFAVVFLTVFTLAAIFVGYRAWQLVHRNDEPQAAGSYGRQFFGRVEKRQKPEDWVKQ